MVEVAEVAGRVEEAFLVEVGAAVEVAGQVGVGLQAEALEALAQAPPARASRPEALAV